EGTLFGPDASPSGGGGTGGAWCHLSRSPGFIQSDGNFKAPGFLQNQPPASLSSDGGTVRPGGTHRSGDGDGGAAKAQLAGGSGGCQLLKRSGRLRSHGGQ